MYYVKYGEGEKSVPYQGEIPEVGDVLVMEFPTLTARYRVYERHLVFTSCDEDKDTRDHYGEWVVFVRREPVADEVQKTDIASAISQIYQKLGDKTVGDKMIWVGPNYSKAQLLVDLEEALK